MAPVSCLSKGGFFQQMHSAHTDTQVIINEAASLYPPTTPPPFLAPRPTVLHSGFISSLWINRDTLSVQRRVVIKVFSCYPRVKKTSTPHFFIIDVLFRGGWNTFPIQVMLLFWGSCTTAPGVRHQPMPCNEVKDKAAFPRVSFSLIKLSMIFFSKCGGCGELSSWGSGRSAAKPPARSGWAKVHSVPPPPALCSPAV